MHSSTVPAVFLQMFETPLLFSLFHLASHILPTRVISRPTSNSLYSPEHIVLPNQTLAPIVSSFSNVLPVLPFRILPNFEIPPIYNDFQESPEPPNSLSFLVGGGCTTHLLPGILCHVLICVLICFILPAILHSSLESVLCLVLCIFIVSCTNIICTTVKVCAML